MTLARFFFPRDAKGLKVTIKPAASSILTISAPVMLLSASLNSVLAGFGVYFGFIWTKDLDQNASTSDSRAVFLVYIIGLGLSYGIYALSSLVSGGENVDGFHLAELFRQLQEAEIHNPLGEGGNTGLEPQPQHQHYLPTREEHIGMPQTTLAGALHEAATLRQQSAEADRRVADMYRELGRLQPLG